MGIFQNLKYWLSDLIQKCRINYYLEKAKQYKGRCCGENEAVKYYDKILQIDHFNIEVYLEKSDCLLDLNRNEEAIACLDKVLEIDNSNVDAYLKKAFLLGLSGVRQREEVIACINKVLEIDNSNVKAYLEKACFSKLCGNFEDAIVCFDKLLEISNSNKSYIEISVYYAMAWCLRRLDRYEEALHYYNETLHYCDNKDFHYCENKCANRDYASIEREMFDYDDLVYYPNEGKLVCLNILERYDDAISLCDELMISAESDKSTWLCCKANALFCLEKYDEAIVLLDEAIKLEFDYASPYYVKSLIFEKLGKLDEAEQLKRKVYELNPEYDPGDFTL